MTMAYYTDDDSLFTLDDDDLFTLDDYNDLFTLADDGAFTLDDDDGLFILDDGALTLDDDDGLFTLDDDDGLFTLDDGALTLDDDDAAFTLGDDFGVGVASTIRTDVRSNATVSIGGVLCKRRWLSSDRLTVRSLNKICDISHKLFNFWQRVAACVLQANHTQ